MRRSKNWMLMMGLLAGLTLSACEPEETSEPNAVTSPMQEAEGSPAVAEPCPCGKDCQCGQGQDCKCGQAEGGCKCGQAEGGCKCGQAEGGCKCGQAEGGCKCGQAEGGCKCGQAEGGCKCGQAEGKEGGCGAHADHL